MSGILVAVSAPTYAIVAVVVFILGAIAYVARQYWRRRQPTPPPEAVTTVIDEPPADKHVRTPSDVLHLIVGVLLVLIGLLVATGASNTLVGFERDLIDTLRRPARDARHRHLSVLPGHRLAHPRRASAWSCSGAAGSGCSGC